VNSTYEKLIASVIPILEPRKMCIDGFSVLRTIYLWVGRHLWALV